MNVYLHGGIFASDNCSVLATYSIYCNSHISGESIKEFLLEACHPHLRFAIELSRLHEVRDGTSRLTTLSFALHPRLLRSATIDPLEI